MSYFFSRDVELSVGAQNEEDEDGRRERKENNKLPLLY